MPTLHDFDAVDLEGREAPLSRYRGQVALVVNVASACGFTPQYAGLQALWARYRAQGLVVLGFPCNQFGAQEPGDAQAIHAFCDLRYRVDFPMFAKVEVNGPGADPLWRWLQDARRGVLGTRAIKWNFTKFLVGRDGRPLRRFGPARRPERLAGAVERALERAPPAG
ncbi:glutathione peroxidase [Luteimonas sp. Y-2-2-4F]|nr:glutathione peroxidase [Luteimonas sp. Y-2-2-4F]MCD9030148.1 glutathione peroxidase [Luteimonas sp. Y-2-2-4F]